MPKGKQHRWGNYEKTYDPSISRAPCVRCGLTRRLKHGQQLQMSYEFNGASTDWGPLATHRGGVPHCPPRVEDFIHFEHAPWESSNG